MFVHNSDPIDILITSWERPEFTSQCLESIIKYTTHPYRIIVVDNGSSIKTVEELQEWNRAKKIDTLILLDKNYGLEPAKNYGLHFVTSEIYIDTDNDILVPPPEKDGDWLSRLLRLMEKNKDYAAIAMQPQVFIGADKSELFRDAPEVKEWDKAGASMRAMRTEVVRRVGGWRNAPKDMEEANRSEEWYICGKLKEQGYKVGYARDLECFHMFSDDENWGYGELDSSHRDIHPRPTDKLYGTKEDFYGKFEY